MQIDGVGDRLLSEKEAAEFLGMTPRFLQARRLRGGGPPFVKLGGRTVRYRFMDLREWVEARVFERTSECSKPVRRDEFGWRWRESKQS